jgi:hypothetical protein
MMNKLRLTKSELRLSTSLTWVPEILFRDKVAPWSDVLKSVFLVGVLNLLFAITVNKDLSQYSTWALCYTIDFIHSAALGTIVKLFL